MCVCVCASFSPCTAVSSQQQLTGLTTSGGGGGAFTFVSPPTSMGVHPQNPTMPLSSTNPYQSTFYSQSQPVSALQPAPITNSAPLTSGMGSQTMPVQTQATYFAPQPSMQAVPPPTQQRRNPNGVSVCQCVCEVVRGWGGMNFV